MAKKENTPSKSEQTKHAILEAGLKLWPNVTARKIADELDMTHPVITYHFGDKLKDAIAEYAVQKGHGGIIAQLIVTKHKAVKKLTPAQRKTYLAAVV